MATTIKPNHEAQMRPLVLTVTANHTLAYTDGEVHQTVALPLSEIYEAPYRWTSLDGAYSAKREAEGATAALLARVFPKAGAL